jgi:hypothetical protein
MTGAGIVNDLWGFRDLTRLTDHDVLLINEKKPLTGRRMPDIMILRFTGIAGKTRIE